MYGVLKKAINLFVENKNVFSTISSYNYNAKYKEWKFSVLRGFYVRIVPTLKSMIPMTLKHQNCVEPLSGNKPILGTQL